MLGVRYATMDGWGLGNVLTAFVVTDAGFDVAIEGKASRQLSAWVLLFCVLRLLPMGLEDVVCWKPPTRHARRRLQGSC